jgi:ankyrin repeat protein
MGLLRYLHLILLTIAAMDAPASDFETYREALIAGDEARIAALIAADRGKMPIDPDGVTVLHKALHIYSSQRIAIVRQLIAAGADVNAAARDGRTPLHWACDFDVPEAVPLLLGAGVKVEARDEDGNTPLFSARPEAARMLIEAGADVRATNYEGNVPLHRNHQAALLAPGVNVRNRAGLTPLHYAAMAGNTRGIEWLLAQGADPKLRTTAATHWRASHMSKQFGPGEPVPAGSRPLDLARARRAATRWSTGAYEAPLKVLEKATR